MSKLLVAVVREVNVDPLLAALIADGRRVTVVPSYGGFLREDSRCLLLAVADDQVANVLEIFGRMSGEDVEVPLFVRERLVDWRATTVHYAGATIFILPLDGIVQT
jgi:uncharacterized protein YaaQ